MFKLYLLRYFNNGTQPDIQCIYMNLNHGLQTWLSRPLVFHFLWGICFTSVLILIPWLMLVYVTCSNEKAATRFKIPIGWVPVNDYWQVISRSNRKVKILLRIISIYYQKRIMPHRGQLFLNSL